MRNSIALPASLGVSPANAQHMGHRDSQQDAFGFSSFADLDFAKHAGYLCVLADGMGGLENGFWSSSHAIKVFIDSYKTKSESETPNDALLRSAQRANAVVYAEAMRQHRADKMGTTIVAAVVRNHELFWLSVGDSRIYLFENNELVQLSEDHNYSKVLKGKVTKGEISLSEAQSHPLRNQLTSNLGRKEIPIISGMPTGSIKLQSGAWILLCSDGLSGVLSDREIADELHGDPQKACDRLVEKVIARNQQNQDNTTVVVMHIPKDGSKILSAQGVTKPLYHSLVSSSNMSFKKLVPPVLLGSSTLGAIVLATMIATGYQPWAEDVKQAATVSSSVVIPISTTSLSPAVNAVNAVTSSDTGGVTVVGIGANYVTTSSATTTIAKDVSSVADTKPTSVKLGNAKKTETKPGEAKPGEAKPGEAKPGEAKPGETKPGETKPGEAKPGEAKLVETKPEEKKSGWNFFKP
jgi:PPM family protein phosphatase